ncbi:MAG: Gfo/Idh/MocA family oxidoreductase [Verrucomicrobia bacterium]|nr:Gfo/Idh/MocA family oxidoreductase [Verrucomicrobiota bacterium]
MKIGVCGVGRFSKSFIELYHAHPCVTEVVLADLLIERAQATAKTLGIKRVLGSLDALCASDVDAIAIFTQRHLHAPQAMQALNAGKHVLCAVPAALNLEDLQALIDTVERTGQIYMLNETSYFYPSAIFARHKLRSGELGQFVYGEAQYIHDMRHMHASFQNTGGPNWKRLAGIPPMFYGSHSVGLVLSITGARATQVSCLGFEDRHADAIFGVGQNEWDNPFSNQSALMRTSDGGMLRVNELRRAGWDGSNSVTMSIFGTDGSMEQTALASCWTRLDPPEQIDITDAFRIPRPDTAGGFQGASRVHPVEELPATFKGLPNGHQGSHYFLVNAFVNAVTGGTLPPCNIWDAASWTAPGLVAHASALKNGEMLAIPDFGQPPTA